jgi:hypothetical protein
MRADPYERLIRWYPPRWRARYGGEMTALLEDRYAAAADVPLRDRIGLARAGVAERARDAGLVGPGQGAADRLRTGSVLVLCGWALFLAAGAIFGKFTDNWLVGTRKTDPWVASTSYHAVVVAGEAGCLVVLAAALVVLPAFVRLVRRGGWETVRRPVWRALVSGALAVVLFGGTVAWAHHLSAHDRNGGLPVYGASVLVTGLAVVTALVAATAAAVGRRVDLEKRSLRALGLMAVGLAGIMVLVFAGIVTWWASESVLAPGVLLNGIGNGLPYTSRVLPPTLLIVGLLMAIGLVLALAGTVRIARAAGPGHAVS